ncbi:VWA domain-containing protein, partial [Microbacteriaceae bacterium]|nr:VWA domain-containing protein [Candidatus Saccharibacteria bacterium]
MAIMYWWLIPIIVVAFALTAWIYVKQSRKSKAVTRSVPIAHSGRLTQLSSYRRLYVQYRRIVLAIIVILGIGLVATTILVARPVSENLVSPQQKNRDIMLCLDVSGSMYGVDKDIFATFRSLVDNFQGQRIGLTVFNSSAVTIVPLTDDYDLLRSYLDKGQIGFNYITKNQYSSDYTSDGYKDFRTMVDGTSANSDAGASLVGD